MNPQHQIPVLKDGDNFTLSESRAIAIYLVEQFGGEGKVHAVWFTRDTSGQFDIRWDCVHYFGHMVWTHKC